MTDLSYSEAKQYVDTIDRIRGTRRPGAVRDRVRGALAAYIGPRLAMDATLDDVDLERVTEDLARGSLRGRRRLVADRVRRAVRGRLGKDADIDDLDELLAHFEREEEGEDEVDVPGMSRPTYASEGPMNDYRDQGEDEGDPTDVELRELLGEEAFDRLIRHGRDRRRADDRRRIGRDQPVFNGAPMPGGGMMRREGEDRHRRAHDSAPAGSFRDRFRFLANARTEDDPQFFGRK